PDDVADLIVDKAMAREPGDRPTALELGQQLQHLQARHGLAVDEIALYGADQPHRPGEQVKAPVAGRRPAGGNLPAQVSSVVGRRAELSKLVKLVATSRLVNVTGIGGIGKTTLAIAAARELRGEFPEGVWLVELADLRDGALVADVVAAAVGV